MNNSTPSSVTPTECSHWADRDLSRVTAVQPSDSTFTCGLPRFTIGSTLKAGMFFTVEPMVNLGKPHVKVLSDGWTAVTRDKSLSSQCEHSVGVTADGVELFSASPAGLFRPKF